MARPRGANRPGVTLAITAFCRGFGAPVIDRAVAVTKDTGVAVRFRLDGGHRRVLDRVPVAGRLSGRLSHLDGLRRHRLRRRGLRVRGAPHAPRNGQPGKETHNYLPNCERSQGEEYDGRRYSAEKPADCDKLGIFGSALRVRAGPAVVRVCQAGGVDQAEPADGALPDPGLVVLVGPSGSGKSVWAAQRYRPDEVVSSDRLRSLVGSGEHDLDASADAFALLDHIVAARLRRGLTVVVDTLGLDPARRLGYLELARGSGMPAVAVLLDTDPLECRRRNRARDRPVPAPALGAQLRRMRTAVAVIGGEGWDLVISARTAQPEPSHPPGRPRLGADPGAVGDAGNARGPGARSPPGHAGDARDVPRPGDPGQDRGHPRRAQRRAVVLRHRGGLVGARARGFRPAVPAGAGPARRAGVGHRDAPRPVGAGHQAVPERAGPAARDDLLSAAGVAEPGH